MPVPQPISDAQKNLSSAIRAQWRLFEKWLVASKSTSEKRREEVYKALEGEMLKSKQDMPYKFHVLLQVEYDAKKSELKRHLDEENVHLAQVEWERRLTKAGLDAEDWVDITPAERLAVERALGGDMESNDGPPSLSPSNGIPTSLSFPSNAWATTQHQLHVPQSAQSSLHHPFELVNPAEFREEHVQEDHLSIKSLYHATTLDDIRPSDLSGSTPSISPERSPPRSASERVPLHGHPPQSTSSASSSQQISPIDHQDSSRQHTKPRPAGNRYIGPVLHDDQDASLEEADFEKFKMEIREKKIWEFHYEAADAGSRLARQLGDRTLDKQQIRDILAGHEQEMETLKRVKEDERKSIVETERAKRQSEIRRRNALYDATANPRKAFEVHIGLDLDLDSRAGQHLARETSATAKQVNGVKAVPVSSSSSNKPQSMNEQEIKKLQERWQRRGRDSNPITADPHQVGESSQSAGAKYVQALRLDDARMPGASEQKKKQPSSKTSPKASDQPPSTISQQNQIPRPAKAGESSTRNEDQEEPKALPTPKSRRKSLSRTPQEFWRPDGLGSQQQDNTSTSTASAEIGGWKIPDKQEFWIPERSETQKDAADEQTEVVESIPEASSQAAEPKVSNLHPVRQIGRLEKKTVRGARSKTVSSARPSQESVAWEEDPILEELPPSARALEKQRQVDDPAAKQDVESTGLATASDILSRPRRASDPPPPSPGLFDVAAVRKQNSESTVDGPKQLKSILKKADRKAPAPAAQSKKGDTGVESKKRGKAAKKNNPPPKPRKSVTIEEVPDEDADPVVAHGPMENKSSKMVDVEQPSSSKVIIEPKPSIPTTSFSQIFQFTSEKESTTPVAIPEPAKPTLTVTQPPIEPRTFWVPPEDSSSDVEEDDGGGWNVLIQPLEERTNKTKHVRWTPGALSNGGHLPDVDNPMAAFGMVWRPEAEDGKPIAHSSVAAQKVKSRGGAFSFEAGRGADAADRVRNSPLDHKGKGKEKAVYRDVTADPPEDNLTWYANQAIENLKGMRSKPASAV